MGALVALGWLAYQSQPWSAYLAMATILLCAAKLMGMLIRG